MALGPKGQAAALVLFLSDDACICFDGSHAGKSEEEYQKVRLELELKSIDPYTILAKY